MKKAIIIINHDGHKFVTSKEQIESNDNLIAIQIGAMRGNLSSIHRNSIYGKIILDEFLAENYIIVQ